MRHLGSMAALLLLANCGTDDCPEGTVDMDGRCVMADAGRHDAGSDGGDGDDAGTDAPMACGGACMGATPHCDTDTDTCVACLDNTHCDESAPVCGAGGVCGPCTGPADCAAYPDALVCGDSGAADGTCVACAGDADCMDADAGKCDTGTNTCVPCDDSDQCTEDGAGVCDMSAESGVCVECNAGDETACGDNVCDVEAMTCTETPAEMTGNCQECVSDRQCSEGRVCVPMVFGPGDTFVGNFCLWREDASGGGGPGGACSTVAPYVDGEVVTTISGATDVSVCGLAFTTCVGLNHARDMPCETPFDDDDVCGVTGLDDGLCRRQDAASVLCTVRCAGDSDCDGVSCVMGETPRYCEL